MSIPECFCWTRFGTEAGQTIEQIFTRKEMERKANDGLFFWGIGNALRPSMLELIQQTESPEVIFSPVRGAPRPQDSKPDAVVSWTKADGLFGDNYDLPKGSLITSRLDIENPRSQHYALVCHSESPIGLSMADESIEYGQLRNLVSGRKVGASQVTSVVRVDHAVDVDLPKSYKVSFRAKLVFPYLIALHSPARLQPEGNSGWEAKVSRLWESTLQLAGTASH